MTKRISLSLLVALLGLASLSLVGCESQGPFEEAGEDIDEGVDEVEDEIEDATD